jgi:hypothetical protein
MAASVQQKSVQQSIQNDGISESHSA